MLKKTVYVVFMSLTVLFIGCSEYNVKEGTFAPVRIRDPMLPATQIRWNNVSLLDRSIQHKILVEATNSRRTPTNTLEVWAIFRNRTDYPLQLEARSSFYDANQAPIEGPTAWQRVHLPPNATANYTNIFSTRIDVGYYTIEVREGR